MKINIVRPTDGWVLQEIAEAWQLPGSLCSDTPNAHADVNIWVNYAMFSAVGKFRKTRCDIGWFTHREPGRLGVIFDRVAAEVDWCIAMCERTAMLLPEDKTTVIKSAPNERYSRKEITLGVVGREYPRKRLDLIPAIESIPGVTIKYTGGGLPAFEMPEFYESVDYIIVLANNEGGPMCVPEAMAMHKPVIAPDVGWCWEYPVIRYGSELDLIECVRGLVPPTIEEESAQIMETVEGVLKC